MRPDVALVPEGTPGAGGTILLLQKWVHDATGVGGAAGRASRSSVIGRTKLDSIELEDKPDDSHVASTDQERFGEIFRRNMPYGTVTDHGTMFVGFAARAATAPAMLESMAGLDDRHPGRAHALHPTAHGRLLLRALDRGRAGADRRRGTHHPLTR